MAELYEMTATVEGNDIEESMEESISRQLLALEDESGEIVFVDYAAIIRLYDKLKAVTTIKRMINIPNVCDEIAKAIGMFEEEKNSSRLSYQFLNIAYSLMSNMEVDYYEIKLAESEDNG